MLEVRRYWDLENNSSRVWDVMGKLSIGVGGVEFLYKKKINEIYQVPVGTCKAAPFSIGSNQFHHERLQSLSA